jgi:hypothetical protein
MRHEKWNRHARVVIADIHKNARHSRVFQAGIQEQADFEHAGIKNK